MSFQTENVDEFGRDLSTRAYQKFYASAMETKRKYAGMSWAEITFMEEEAEEEENRKKEAVRMRKVDKERRLMYIMGNYELEDGEVFE
jgi:hypothetical protein